MTDVVKILRAFRPGDVVFIETDERTSHDALEHMSNTLATGLKDTGVRVVILHKGMRVAAAEEIMETSNLETPDPRVYG